MHRLCLASTRATIRERGTARHWTVLVGFAIWAALTVAVGAYGTDPVEVLIPLVLLLVALYCGIPAANEAHRAAVEVLKEEAKA